MSREVLESGPGRFDPVSDRYVLSQLSTPSGGHLVAFEFEPGEALPFAVRTTALSGQALVQRFPHGAFIGAARYFQTEVQKP